MEINMLKKKIEAILFASGRKVDLAELAKLCKTNNNEILKAIKDLKKNSSIENCEFKEFRL